jgi:Neurotransmitter-gated ion-channel transmembrane region
VVFVVAAGVLGLSRAAFAGESSCNGAAACCPQQIDHGPARHAVSVGVIVMGLSSVNERAGTWDADFYLYEEWTPEPNFAPVTEIVNEVERHSTQFEEITLRDGRCVRSHRIHSTLRAPYNLRTFPFDHQQLAIEVSDDEFTSSELSYQDHAFVVGFDDAVRSTLSGWKLESELVFGHESRAFRWERGSPSYDYASFRFEVRRHVTFHLIKYFLPLLLIVALAFSVFWIAPDDLGAALTIGVTCLLAVIAFQFSEASALPEVAYLTLADRVYVVCYVAIAMAVFETIYTNNVSRRGNKTRAVRIDRRCRKIFPGVVFLALIASIVRAFTESA